MAPRDRTELRYAVDEAPPHAASLVMGLPVAVLVCLPVVIVTTVVTRAANLDDAYLAWAIFASMVVGGLTTILQAVGARRIGAGTLTVMGASGASIGVALVALVAGGPPLLGTLVVVSALFQFGLASRLALLRRIITPVVSGTLMALISVTVMPLGFAMLSRVPADAPAAAAPVIAAVTLIVAVGVMLRGSRALRALNAVLAIGAGCATAALFGAVDLSRVGAVSWFGFPTMVLPGLETSFGPSFWVLLPGFLFVTFVITIRQVGDSVRMQRISSRTPRATDFRRVQGGVAACGVGTLLSGFAGTLPLWPYATGMALATGPGIAARRVGVYIGAIFVGLAFVPKVTTLIASIPQPVLGAYLIMIFGVIFAQAMRVIFQEGVAQANALVAGLSFWIGAGIQFGAIFPEHLATPTGRLLANGLTAGGLAVLLLTLFIELTGPRRRRTEVPLSPDSLPELDRFVVDFAARYRWTGAARERLRAAAEEALASLLRDEEEEHAPAVEGRRLRLVARRTGPGALLEFTAATHAGNLENQMVLLGDRPDPASERDLSLALLRHHASSVRHQQYHNVDILTVRVDRA